LSAEGSAGGRKSLKSSGDDAQRNIVRNTLAGYVRQVVDTGSFLIITPFLIETIGAESFGLWSLVWAIVSFLMLLDLGVGPAVMKLVADARGRDDFDDHQRSVATVFWLYVIQGACVAALVAGFIHFSDLLFDKLSAQELVQAERILMILGGGVAVGMPLGMFRAISAGHQKIRYVYLYEGVGIVVYLLLVLLVLPHFRSLEALAVMNASTILLGYLLVAIHAKTTLPGTSLRVKYADFSLLPKLWSYSFFFALSAVAMVIATRVDLLIAQWAFDLRAVMLYTLAMRVTGRAAQAGVQISASISPVVAELTGKGDGKALLKVWLKGTKYSTAIAFPLIGGLVVLAEPLLATWVSDDVLEAAPILSLLAVASMILVTHSTSHQMLAMRGRQRPLALIILAGQIVNLLLSIGLAKSFGLMGIAIATLAVVVVQDGGIVLGMVTREQGSSRREFYRATVLPSLLPLLVMMLAIEGWQLVHPITSLLEVAAVEFAGLALFGALFFRFGMDEDEREDVRGRVSRRLGRSRAA
jgi:O-antigen/teichoic acid export membrane protein